MSDRVGTPRLIVNFQDLDLDGNEVLTYFIDSANDGVISFDFKAPQNVLKIRFLDENGLVASRLAGWQMSDYASRHLDANGFAIGAPESRTNLRLVYTMAVGDDQSEPMYGTIIGYRRLETTDDNVVSELTIAPATDKTARERISDGPSYGFNDYFRTGRVPIGTITESGKDYAPQAKYNIEFKAVIRAMEDVLAYPTTYFQEGLMGAVVLSDNLYDAIKSVYDGDGGGVVFQEFLFTELGFAYVRKGDTYFLADAGQNIADQLDDDDPALSKLSPPAQYVAKRLNNMAAAFGIPERYGCMPFGEHSMVKMFRGDREGVRQVFLFAEEFVLQNLISGGTEVGTKSNNSKALQDAAKQMKSYKKWKYNTTTRKGLMRMISDNVFPILRHGTVDSNVISIIAKQSNDAFDYGLLTRSTKLLQEKARRLGTSNIKKMTYEQVIDIYKKRALTSLTSVREVMEELGNRGINIQTSSVQDGIAATVEVAVDETLRAVEPNLEPDPAGVAGFLTFLRAKQRKGADVITVKIPIQCNLTNMDLLFQPVLLFSTNPTTTRADRVIDNSVLTGFYMAFALRHVVTSNTAHTEIDMVKQTSQIEEFDNPVDIARDVYGDDIDVIEIEQQDGSVIEVIKIDAPTTNGNVPLSVQALQGLSDIDIRKTP